MMYYQSKNKINQELVGHLRWEANLNSVFIYINSWESRRRLNCFWLRSCQNVSLWAKASFSADDVKIQRVIVNISLVPKEYIEGRLINIIYFSKDLGASFSCCCKVKLRWLPKPLGSVFYLQIAASKLPPKAFKMVTR